MFSVVYAPWELFGHSMILKVFQKTACLSANRKAAVQYLAVDGKARAVMIGTVENMKHVYVFADRESSKHPLTLYDTTYDASTKESIIYDMVAVENYDDPENVVFACLEAKYKDIFPSQKIELPKQFIAFYQLNTAYKSIGCIPLDDLTDRGNFLIPVPDDHGILLCALNCIMYYKLNHPVIRCPIPRRLTEVTKRSIMFVCAATCRLEKTFFFLVQTEQGDIFRVTLEKNKSNMVTEIQLKYFSTVNVASALCFFNSGFLYVAAEFGNHILYEIVQLDDDGPEFSSSLCLDQDDTFFFLPVALKNLVVVKIVPNLSPIMQLEMMLNMNPGNEYLLLGCGRGQSSSLRFLQRQFQNYKYGSQIFIHTEDASKLHLNYTPRKFKIMSSNVIVIGTDHNALTEKTRNGLRKEIMKELTDAAEKYNKLFNEEENLHLALSGLLWKPPGEKIPNLYQTESGMWASVIRFYNFEYKPLPSKVVFSFVATQTEMEQNEAACSMSLVKFGSQEDVQFLLVGVVNKLQLGCNIAESGRIFSYKIINGSLELVHKTVVEDCPSVICPFRGLVLIGIGSTLKIYDYSEEMLFVKYEIPNLCNRIVSIHVVGDNIYVADVRDGLISLLYKNEDDGQEGKIEIFAKDIDPVWITTTCLWGNDKLARADKFGNISIVRLPTDSFNEESSIPTVINDILPQNHKTKVDMLATFHVGEIVCSLEVGHLSYHQRSEVLMYATFSGSIGMLAPIEENEVPLIHFEMLMRVMLPPFCGGDHLAFRSSYYPLLNVIDGDLLEQFYYLSDVQQEIIQHNIRTCPYELLEKLRFTYLGK